MKSQMCSCWRDHQGPCQQESPGETGLEHVSQKVAVILTWHVLWTPPPHYPFSQALGLRSAAGQK